jgi:hypothetical protein
VQTIYSLTVNFIERFLSNKNSRSELESLKAAIGESRYADALAAIDSLLEKSGLDIHDLRQRRIFVLELNFIASVINFKLGNLSRSRAGFAKCVSMRHLAAYSSLFMAAAADSRQSRSEAHGYIAQYASDGSNYQYFKLMELKISFEDGEYEKAALAAKKLIDILSARKNDVKLLPPVEFNIVDAFYIKSLIESVFELNDFLYEILFIAAESNFYTDNYETAFEYYKEASFCRDGAGTQAACFYKMACSKMRVSDFITARGLLEKTLEITGENGRGGPDRDCVLLDLANLYEYHFGETEKAVQALSGYVTANSGDTDAVLRLASLLYEKGRYNEAVVYLAGARPDGAENQFSCAILTAKCHYASGGFSECLGILDPFLAGNSAQPGGNYFQALLLAAKCLIMLNKYDLAGEAVKKIRSCAAGGEDKFQVAEFLMFFNHLKAAPYIIFVNKDRTDIFRGFVKHGSLDIPCSRAGEIKDSADKISGGDALVMVSRDMGPAEYAPVRAAFAGKITVYEKHLGFINSRRYCVSLRDNPLGYSSPDPCLAVFIVFVSLMGRINLNNMPQLYIDGDGCADGPGSGSYSGVLRLYELFKTGGGRFAVFTGYTRAAVRGGEDGGPEDDKSRLWPFIINFKNIDVSCGRSGDDIERILANGSPDIFVYNYLRENKADIDGSPGVHFFVDSARAGHFKKILEFILKKLGYARSSILSFDDIEGLFCMKKVNELLGCRASSECESFDILSVVLSMSSGVRSSGSSGASISDGLMERIKFCGGDCDYEICAERNICKIRNILDSYASSSPAFYISPFGNFFFVNRRREKPPAFSEFRQVFLGAAGFYIAGENYHKREASLTEAVVRIEKVVRDENLAEEDAKVFAAALAALKSASRCFNEFIRRCDDAAPLERLCASLAPCVSAAGRYFGGADSRTGSLIKMASDLSSAAGPRAKALLKAENGSVSLVIYNQRWAGDIIFDRSARKIYFISEEDPDEYYENKLSVLFKFFKRVNIAEKYFQAAAITANILVQAENGPEYKNIVNKFLSNSKKAAVFFLNSSERDETEFIPAKSSGILYRFIDLPSDIETDLVDLDCVVINYHYKNREHARSFLTMLKNVIVKYNVNLFWMVVSTELFENAFARGSNFLNIGRVRLYSNEIEYANAFYGEQDNVNFLSRQSSGAYYDGAGAVEMPGKYDIYYPGFHDQAQKFWQQAYENIIDRNIRTLCDERSELSEKTAFIITMMALYTRFKKHIIIYIGSAFEKTRFDNFLYRFELVGDSYKSERNRVVILRDREYENFAMHEKGVRHSEALLINFNARFMVFNSDEFNVIEYEKWQAFSSRFDHALNLVSIAPPQECPDQGTYGDFYAFACAAVKERPQDVHIICSRAELTETIHYGVCALFKTEDGRRVPYCISYENAGTAVKNIIEKNQTRRVRIYLTGSSSGDSDSRLAASRAAEFEAYPGVTVARYQFFEGEAHPRLPDIFYNEAAFMEAFIRQYNSENIAISLEELSTYLPASVFSKASASRCLAVLSKMDIVKVSRADRDAEEPGARDLDHSFLNELSASGAIRIFFTPAQGEKYSITDLLRRGLIRVADRCELIDRFYTHYKDPVKISVKMIADGPGGFDLLKKMARVRKNMLRCLYDIDGFREGKPVALPISDFHDMSPNDFYYIREFSFLKWHNACEFTRNENCNPGFRRILSQIQIERLTENLERDLNDLYAILLEIEGEGKLSEADRPSRLASALKARGGQQQIKQRENLTVSYTLKLLKHLFLYGLINLAADIPFEREDYAASVELSRSAKIIDYKGFIEACEKMYKIN